MKKLLLNLMALLLIASTLCTVIPLSASAEEEFDNVFEIEINGFDCSTEPGRVSVYPNDSDTVRYVKSYDYGANNLSGRRIFVFNAEGRLLEIGDNLQDNGPQLGVKIPAGGFMIACRTGSKLDKCYKVVAEDAVFFNSTINVLREAYATYDDKIITIKYNDPEPTPEDATTFLFVGNSSTYYSGTPLTFKALAKAAGKDIEIYYSTFGSAYLHEFADPNNSRGQTFRKRLQDREYDYVVLQDAAKSTYDTTKTQVEKLLPLIQQNGATALLYMRYSSGGSAQGIAQNAKKHYDNYATIAKDFSLTCAPSAEAFIFSASQYPDINLYADDGGHHSKEGAYLIACTWLYSYLGINPVGNTYTANLPEDTAKKLQECALKACEEGYFERENNDIFTNPKVNGSEEDNDESDASSESEATSSEATSSEAVSETASTQSTTESTDNTGEPENKSMTWLYWVIGGVVLVGGIVAVALISKKK